MPAVPSLTSAAISFEPLDGWAKLPEGWSFMEVGGIAVDEHDNAYVFNRGEHPIIVFDRDGNVLRSFGEGIYHNRAHGIHYGVDSFIYCVDDARHCVDKFTTDGRMVWTLGEAGKPAPKWSGQPFNRPTHAFVSPKSGDLFVSDGYGNSMVHRYSPDGKLITSWGGIGCEPGEFQHPHALVVDADENVFVADRENNRVQVFDGMGKLQAIWHDIYRPDGFCMDKDGLFFVGELRSQDGFTDVDTLGHRISVHDKSGKRIARLGDPMLGEDPGQFIAPHGCATDSRGDLYVGDVSYTSMQRGGGAPKVYRSFQKLRRL
ncbi:MAG: hypothetical protein EXR52_02745 [Dehalococcoidia bacterium]|nr:hypothetical protein [Dehalococcoidia bacterium]